jgi:uncharacterized membrane protein
MIMLLAGLVLLLAPHSVSIFSPGWRDRAMARVGRAPWMGFYSLASLVGLALIVEGFGAARQSGGLVYSPPSPHLALVVMVPVFPLAFAAVLPGRIRTAARHPLTLAILLWSAAHLLANGRTADVVLFGAFFVWAAAEWMSQGHRPPRPPAAARRWNDVIAVAAGLALYGAFILGVHRWLFGVSPLG